VRHDVKQDFVFRLKVVIEPALRKLERCRDIIHRGGIISPLLKEARGGAQDLLSGFLPRLRPGVVPGIEGSFAKRHRKMVSRNRVSLYCGRTRWRGPFENFLENRKRKHKKCRSQTRLREVRLIPPWRTKIARTSVLPRRCPALSDLRTRSNNTHSERERLRHVPTRNARRANAEDHP
jgi:hypothetical protein